MAQHGAIDPLVVQAEGVQDNVMQSLGVIVSGTSLYAY